MTYKDLVPKQREEIRYKECSLCGDRYINERDKGFNECFNKFQPLIDYVEKLEVECKGYKDEIEKQAVEIESLEFKVEKLEMALDRIINHPCQPREGNCANEMVDIARKARTEEKDE